MNHKNTIHNIKLVIFDLDGTTLDTLQDLTDSINHVLEISGYPTHSIEEIRSYVGNGIRKLVERAVPEGLSEAEIDKVFHKFMEHYSKNCDIKTKPYEGIIEILEVLKEKEICVAINSNKNHAEVKFLVDKYYGKLVDYCVGSFEDKPRKPAPDGVFRIMEHFNVNREETIYVGDSEVDIQTIINANINGVLVDWGFREHEVLENCLKNIEKDTKYSGTMKIVSTWQQLLNEIV